jgi:hypothetical protein
MNIEVLPQDNGFVVLQDGQKLMGAFGNLPMWFETEASARHYAETADKRDDNMQAALQTLITQLRYKTGQPMHMNAEGIQQALNADALFYPYPGPESVEQYAYFEPMRAFLEKRGFAWRDLDQSEPYTAEEIEPLLVIIQNLSLAQQARLLYLMLNAQNLFVAPLGYITGDISQHAFLEAWLFNAGGSVSKKSKAYQGLAGILERLNEY